MKQINEGFCCALASEKALSKNWNNKEDKKAWKNLKKLRKIK